MSGNGPKMCWARTVALLTAILLVVPLPAAAQERAGCAEVFGPDTFDLSDAAGPVTVFGSGLAPPLFDRFVGDIETSASMIAADLGSLDGVEVCLFPEVVPLDPDGLVPEGQLLHAVAFNEGGVLALGVRPYSLVKPAAAFGLASMALWGMGESPHPEPLATTIGQWYSSRAMDRLEVNHNAMLYSNLLSRASEWPLVVTEQAPVRAWNPEFQDSAASDLIEFAVVEHGPSVLAETAQDEWSTIGRDWSAALSAELRPNGLGTTWIWGGAIFFGAIVLAAVLAYIQWRNKRSKRRPEEWTDVLPLPVETGLETPIGSGVDR